MVKRKAATTPRDAVAAVELSDEELSNTSVIEKLLLAQSVFEHGNTDWNVVFESLDGHDLLPEKTALRSPEACKSVYAVLMQDLGFDVSDGFSKGAKPKAKAHESLAKKFFLTRVADLRSVIFAEEERFRTLYREIEEIKAGIWDERIKDEAAEQSDAEEDSPVVEKTEKQKGRKGRKGQDADVSSHNAAADDAEDANESNTEQDDDMPAQEEDFGAIEPPKKTIQKSGRKPPKNRKSVTIEDPESSPDVAEEVPTEEKVSKTKKTAVEKKRKRDTTPAEEEPESATVVERSKKRVKKDDSELFSPASPIQVEQDPAAAKRFRTAILQIVGQITNHPNASIFREPVRKQEAPNYSEIIYKPMDLKTLAKRVRDGTITNTNEFRRDMLLIFANAVMFNHPSSDVAIAAKEMAEHAQTLLHLHDTAEAL